jgi:integrase
MKYYLGKEGGLFVIRSWPGNRRHPIKEYRLIRSDKEKLEEYIKRLNVPHELRTWVSYKHAFINDALLNQYSQYLKNLNSIDKTAQQEYSYLRRYVIHFFVDVAKLINPADWLNAADTQWAAYLLKEAPASKKTRQDIINAGNRFMGWLHRQRPNEVPNRRLEPLTRRKLNEAERLRIARGEAREAKLIPHDVVESLCRYAPENIRGAICLMARYGLRRNEALGVVSGDVKKGGLHIWQQLVSLGKYGPPKGKKERHIPHWNCRAAEAYAWVEEVKAHPMNPRTFSTEWDHYVKGYTPHDLRHTFITRMVRAYPLIDVSKAAGHKDVRVTQGYMQDDRNLDLEPFDPAG